ncbi:CBS domain-containing protein [Shewanella sp. NIFS-20-20]|uniref:CBS domain-containing protein n=1 Tax=Shewanella sp. NIFS-20-20 TaxID=2853806 RepID=UPI001C43A938|nr:CBS domain-containing protein [Shewanella sp. NIFS-20-20]MBV7314946.1 CBS domain-containing protein [Shewanella sp. NIFS-20-20]
MQIVDIMSHKLVTVAMDDRLKLVQDIFKQTQLHHLPVFECKALVGLVSERDLLRAINPNVDNPLAKDSDRICLNKRVHQIMTRKVITIEQDQSLNHAAQLLVEHNIGCLPVTHNEQVVGIISWKDVLRSLYQQDLSTKRRLR